MVFSFDKSVHERALEIKHMFQFVSAANPEGVLHHHHPHFLKALNFNSEHTINASQQTFRILLVVVLKSGQQLDEEIHLAGCHSFDDDFVVVREEKEGSTATCSFAGFEDAVTVEPGAQTSPHSQSALFRGQCREHQFEQHDVVPRDANLLLELDYIFLIEPVPFNLSFLTFLDLLSVQIIKTFAIHKTIEGHSVGP